MTSPRDQILAKVRAALDPLPERAALPDWTADLAIARQVVAGRDRVELFTERIRLVNGRAVFDPATLVRDLLAGGWTRGYCDPALWPLLAPHFGPEFTVETSFERQRVDDYAFGITRAVGAIAETGTIILGDRTTTHRLAALAPWVHIAVVRKGDIQETLADATTCLADDPNLIFVTGPSKTADVEGILIEGVHGPGVQYALVVE